MKLQLYLIHSCCSHKPLSTLKELDGAPPHGYHQQGPLFGPYVLSKNGCGTRPLNCDDYR
ncbi:hypothetical protein B0H10DRAFT_632810 [Mycena sp. CBHHK59/15]|nr:hypothetical protein B0H10DRAFT_632810 [Mycena sp. CBHHK59/15]